MWRLSQSFCSLEEGGLEDRKIYIAMLLTDFKGSVLGDTGFLDGGFDEVAVNNTDANICIDLSGNPGAFILWGVTWIRLALPGAN